MPDDRQRIARFADEVRTDLSFADRMARYCRAQAVRLCREIAAASGGGHFVPALADAGRERLVLEGGRSDVSAVVELSVAGASGGSSGISVRIATEGPRETSFAAELAYRPALRRFEGEVSIAPAAGFGAEFDSLWREVCLRHRDVADFERFRRAFDSAGRPGATGLVLAGVDGPGLPADEYTFLFVRDAGRALAPAAAPLLTEGL